MALPLASVNAQDARNRATSTIVSDALAQMPAQTQQIYNQTMAELAATGAEGIEMLALMLEPMAEGVNNSPVEYAVNGVASYVSKDGAAQRDGVRAGLKAAIAKTTNNPNKAFLMTALQICATADDAHFFAEHLKDQYMAPFAARALASVKGTDHAVEHLMAEQADCGHLEIEFVDDEGTACARIDLTDQGEMRSKGGARYGRVVNYEPGKVYHVKVDITLENRNSTVYIDGKKTTTRMLFAPVESIERVVFRTGARRHHPTVDTWADQFDDLPRCNEADPEATYRIGSFKSISRDVNGTAAVLHYADFAHYAERFNAMEDENIVQAIPNSASSAWMEQNIPLFECPQHNFEELFYYRWWTLRKHIKETPVGYGMTEFLVNRSYADKYNLIACAIGHHIYESRWLHNQDYLNQIIHTWYRGNEGKPMAKMIKFSSWNPNAVWNRYLVNMDKAYLTDLYADLKAEYAYWEETHRLPSGLYWQGDVQDGMEESISGGRKKQYARPTINSYMYGNAKALAEVARLLGNKADEQLYEQKAAEIKELIYTKLWNDEHGFFETMRGEERSNVREAIGYIPWYFNLPEKQHENAWLQINDKEGFDAPYGLTTAERRHPEFRTHGVGKCEWDGAIWPFASSQTLTALANYLNTEKDPVVTEQSYFRHMELYVESMHHRGRPYIGEYLDEVTGYWLKGDQERARYYNHSTFNDLMITGLVGLRPRADRTLEVNPLIPDTEWDWFCLDNVLYHNHIITIVWDRHGDRYHLGKGLTLLVDGKKVGHNENLDRIICENVL